MDEVVVIGSSATLSWSTPPLADLTIDETFVYYDGPKLFTAAAPSGVRFLCEWAEETDTYDRWLCTRISDQRRELLRAGATTIRDIFTHPEFELYVVTEYCDSSSRTEVEQKGPETVPDQWLPADDARLSADGGR
ncbi:DUF6575 domain-containing protein [Mycobacteroides abscessus]|uniref:DUF6575 domain-containing protein n=1 Tax=Mycobacteroides abscessus TaxID=36809 RepID=UPI0009294FFE|nr:DUF6575 domain-containing protein [Mycobacteroides abscessus]QSN49779.1 hypothetical protein I3U33_26990 [Mycobacteroides abscessus subsp. abscessus]SII83211.1 Uncharacterised protein [Mycobacteroides abscessus subsp. abscessus]SIK57905.1 Uncharacterised protein [Mycobacteroides abscessus subsp. abscessus]SIL83751.1 Uncharacterised protein [Mycobacteroides abscessus subsp. abscessus]SIM13217.1 Uncharacterised protein [Mycobacteroides abscessus subsp. abscessus]